MIRVVTTCLAAALFLAVPVLCVGGMLEHACDCAEDACCPSECDCDGRSSCGHESGCTEDPCGFRVVRSERHNGHAALASHAAASSTILLTPVTPLAARSVCAGACPRLDGIHLPFPSSDLPLLI